MCLVISIGTLISGIIATWLIAREYYKRGYRDQTALFRVFSKETREFILGFNKENISVKELNDLLYKQCIDDHSGEDPLPYKKCPRCGSDKLAGRSVYNEEDTYYEIKCEECDWSEGTE